MNTEFSRPPIQREDPRFGGNRTVKLQTNWGIDNDLWRSKEEFTAFKRALIAYLPTDPTHGWRQDPAEHVRQQLAKAMLGDDDAEEFIFGFWAKYSPETGIKRVEAPWRSLDECQQRSFVYWVENDLFWAWQRNHIPNWVNKVLYHPRNKHSVEVWEVWLSYCAREKRYADERAAQLAAYQAEMVAAAARPKPTKAEMADFDAKFAALRERVLNRKTPFQEKEEAYALAHPDPVLEAHKKQQEEDWAREKQWWADHPVMSNGRRYGVKLDQYCIVNLPGGGQKPVQLDDPEYANVRPESISHYSPDCQLRSDIPDEKIYRLPQIQRDIDNYQKILVALGLA